MDRQAHYWLKVCCTHAGTLLKLIEAFFNSLFYLSGFSTVAFKTNTLFRIASLTPMPSGENCVAGQMWTNLTAADRFRPIYIQGTSRIISMSTNTSVADRVLF